MCGVISVDIEILGGGVPCASVGGHYNSSLTNWYNKKAKSQIIHLNYIFPDFLPLALQINKNLLFKDTIKKIKCKSPAQRKYL